LALLASCFIAGGCGKGSEESIRVAAVDFDASGGTHEVTLEPTEIVSQFLDRVRRGGDDSGACELLTKLAQQEMTRIGRPLQFPGSPDTTFEVRQSFPVPDQTNAVWVHTYLAEPGPTGQSVQYEVVWTVRKENPGWRICGFVVDQGEDLEPMQIDFENGDEMEARLAALEAIDDGSRQ
jgi:hypothetical protein